MTAWAILTELLLPAILAQATPLPHEPIIDVHQHATGMWFLPDGSPPPLLCVNQARSCRNHPSRYTNNEALLRGTLEIMDRYNIVRAMVSSGDSVRARPMACGGTRPLCGWPDRPRRPSRP